MLRFPSIGQFNQVIKAIRQESMTKTETGRVYDFPVLQYVGTPKIHGTNASLVRYHRGEDFKIQSRNRTISPEHDNKGFAKYVREQQGYFEYLFDSIENITCSTDFQVRHNGEGFRPQDTISIYGEWAGKGIQGGVALTELPFNIFVIFAIGFGDEENRRWLSPKAMNTLANMFIIMSSDENKKYNCYFIQYFGQFEITIDFVKPKEIQNKLIELTSQVEKECPVGKHFGLSGIGEGIVWKPLDPSYQDPTYWFKVKGEQHSISKVKTLAEVDVEKLASLQELQERVLTENRLEQAIEYLQEMGHPLSQSSTGHFLKWIVADVEKEEKDVLELSGLESKEIYKALATNARIWFFKRIEC